VAPFGKVALAFEKTFTHERFDVRSEVFEGGLDALAFQLTK
jgi:hypothetical protein